MYRKEKKKESTINPELKKLKAQEVEFPGQENVCPYGVERNHILLNFTVPCGFRPELRSEMIRAIRCAGFQVSNPLMSVDKFESHLQAVLCQPEMASAHFILKDCTIQ
ncbi:hypothetical protein RRG08_024920 [Elysia crispata]|uniref:Uncharacterized protein n=1 Tax=Elysia crispata TaxID=231223 RepID=A0AAE1A1I0_9GAST|nr:hypothetical protein RRG08_024920 [Elysia crispata]